MQSRVRARVRARVRGERRAVTERLELAVLTTTAKWAASLPGPQQLVTTLAVVASQRLVSFS